ncbi:MAG TPA: class I SAM-dependent methyltransferase [Kofleriaceae bacterium]|nr:class I SAM-dependent methyltransferase [Kofleriaceae bacterium]
MFAATAELYDLIYGHKDYAAEVAKVRAVIDRERPGARTILDVACGTGEHARILAESFDVDALDLDPTFVAIASKKLPRGRVALADMRSFALDRTYDVVQCLFSSIGYVLTAADAIATLACFRDHLAPGGIVLVEPWFEPAAYRPGVHMLTVDRPELKIARVHASRVEADVSILDFNYLVGTPDGVRHELETHRLRLTPFAEMATWFDAAGLAATFDAVGPSGRGLFVARAR